MSRLPLISAMLLVGCLAPLTPAAAQRDWASVATRGDASRDRLIRLAVASLYDRHDCTAALRQAEAAAEDQPARALDPRIPLIAARATACMGDSAVAVLNYATYRSLGGSGEAPSAEFGAVCRAVFRPDDLPSAEALEALRPALQEERDALKAAFERVRPRIERRKVATNLPDEYERQVTVNISQVTDGQGLVTPSENRVTTRGRWMTTEVKAIGNAAEARRLYRELEAAEARLACLNPIR